MSLMMMMMCVFLFVEFYILIICHSYSHTDRIWTECGNLSITV